MKDSLQIEPSAGNVAISVFDPYWKYFPRVLHYPKLIDLHSNEKYIVGDVEGDTEGDYLQSAQFAVLSL